MSDFFSGYGPSTRMGEGSFNYNSPSVLPPTTGQEQDVFTKLFGGKNQTGYLQTGLDVGQGIFNAYAGLKQLGLARDSLNLQKNMAGVNLENQAQMINTNLQDRQQNRLASAGIMGDSPELRAYMEANRVRGTL